MERQAIWEKIERLIELAEEETVIIGREMNIIIVELLHATAGYDEERGCESTDEKGLILYSIVHSLLHETLLDCPRALRKEALRNLLPILTIVCGPRDSGKYFTSGIPWCLMIASR